MKLQKIIQGLKSSNSYKIVKGTVDIILKGPYLKIPIDTFYLSKNEEDLEFWQRQYSTIYFGIETLIENIQF